VKYFLIFLALYSYSSAQTVKWSAQLQDNKKVPYLSILGAEDNGNFYVLRSNMSLDNDKERSGFRNRVYILQYYSSDLALLWEKDLKTSYLDGHISDVKLINSRLYVTSYLLDKKVKQYYFYTQNMGGDAKWIGQPMLLDSFAAEKMDEENKPGLISSRDQSQIAFSYRVTDKNGDAQIYKAVLLDTNLTIKYKREIAVPVPINLFLPIDFTLTDQGSFFVLGLHYLTEKRIKAPDESYYELYGYNKVLGRIVNSAIRSESRFLTDVGFMPDNINHSIVVAGFYSDKALYSTAGVFYYSLTEDSLHETKAINTPFSNEYLQKFLGERKESRELVNYTIRKLNLRRDGGVAVVAESMYETTRSYFDYYMQSFISHIYYHFGNIMVLSINPDGNILWNDVINKDQNSVDDDGFTSGFFMANTGGMLAVIYNKYIDDDSSVLLSSINATGAQKTDVLFKDIEKVVVLPQSGKQIDEDVVIMPAYRQNKLYMLKISF
jgi:hypothetical protein